MGQELGKNADEQLEYFKCSVPLHLYLYLQGTTTIKEAMENIKRACTLDRVRVQAAPVETTTTQSVPFMQMTERPDSRNIPRNDEHIELTALKFKGVIDSLNKFMERLTKSIERSVEKQNRRLDRDRRSSTDSRDSKYSRRSYRSDSDSSSEDDGHRSRSRDSSRRSRSRGRTIKTCTDCHKPNHDLSHCYRLAKDLKKLYSGNLKIDGSGDKDEQARWQML